MDPPQCNVPNTATGLQDIHTRMLVGKIDKLPNIDARLVADKRKLIGKSNLYIATRVLRQFAHFCRATVRFVKRTLYKLGIELNGLIGRFRI